MSSPSKIILIILLQIQSYSDSSGNPITEQVQSVAVTDTNGNPVTGKSAVFIVSVIACKSNNFFLTAIT